MNKVIMAGRLTKDPELRQTTSGITVCNFAIAVSRAHKNADGSRTADFFNCIAWRGTGEFVHNYFRKGDGIVLCGELQSRNYDDKTGHKRTAVDIVADTVEFAQGKSAKSNADYGGMQQMEDSDLPF